MSKYNHFQVLFVSFHLCHFYLKMHLYVLYLKHKRRLNCVFKCFSTTSDVVWLLWLFCLVTSSSRLTTPNKECRWPTTTPPACRERGEEGPAIGIRVMAFPQSYFPQGPFYNRNILIWKLGEHAQMTSSVSERAESPGYMKYGRSEGRPIWNGESWTFPRTRTLTDSHFGACFLIFFSNPLSCSTFFKKKVLKLLFMSVILH